MKSILFIISLCLSSVVFAQEYKYTLKGNAADTWVEIKELAADLNIEGVSGSEIRIVTNDYKGLPEKAKGLMPLSASGPENTGIGLSVLQEGNTITIVGTNTESDDSEYTLYLPASLNLRVKYNNWRAGDVLIQKMAGQVEASTQSSDLELIDITGPIIAHTLSSDLKVTMSSLSQTSPSSITSTSGDIELIMPANVKGTFAMSSVSGGVYTDMNFDLGEEATRRIGGSSYKGKLNGGGVEVALRSVSGDIFIRKAK